MARSDLTTTEGRALTFGSREVTLGWRWKDREGQFHAPQAMVSRHLFHTFRMIWNNHMPEAARVGAVRLYRFGPFYSPSYMREAVVILGRELMTRTDLDPEWERQLAQMAAWFAEFEEVDEPRLDGPRLALTQETDR